MALEFLDQDVNELVIEYGIGNDPGGGGGLVPFAGFMRNHNIAMDEVMQLIQDAAPTNQLQQQLVTAPNAGIPWFVANYQDPKVIEVLITPNKAAKIFGEEKKGDWTTDSVSFPLAETTGEIAAYGDYNENGMVDSNVNWEYRQFFRYQCFTQWGDLELEKAGLAKIDWAARQNLSSIKIMAQAANKFYFYGVAGLNNYGLLNDPALPAPITPAVGTWKNTLGINIVNDVINLFAELQAQCNDNISMDDPLILAMPSIVQPYLANPVTIGGVAVAVSVKKYLEDAFPKMRFETAVQYATTAGNLVQMIIPEVQGQETGFCCFGEKMRAHRIINKSSSTYQKKSASSAGAVIQQPFAVAALLGV